MGCKNQFGKKGVYFADLCGKMKRNLAQMTPDQIIEYKNALFQLRSEIGEAAVVEAEWAIFGNWYVLDGDSQENIIKRAVAVMKEDWWLQRFRVAARQLFIGYDAEKFYSALIPLSTVLAFRAYGPYWVSKCSQDRGGDFRSAIIDKRWRPGYRWDGASRMWTLRDGAAVFWLKALPPTTQELREEFKKTMEGFR